MEEKKYYTFFGNGTVMDVTLSNVQTKNIDGKQLVTARACVSNRAQAISKLLDKEITPDDKGNVWIDVCFWEDKAERFLKFIGDRDRVRVVVVGNLTSKEFSKKDGSHGVAITLNAITWETIGQTK